MQKKVVIILAVFFGAVIFMPGFTDFETGIRVRKAADNNEEVKCISEAAQKSDPCLINDAVSRAKRKPTLEKLFE